MSVECVLWDHDGVLVDTEPVFFEATAGALSRHGIDVSHERWAALQAGGEGIIRLIRDGGLSEDEIPRIRRERDGIYGELLAARDVLVDGAREVVEEVTARYRSVLVTTSLRRFVDQMHGHTGLLDFFEDVITAEDCTRHKPHPEPYLRGLRRLGITPDRGIAIEDSPRGFTAARAAGLRCLVVRTEFIAPETFGSDVDFLDHIGDLSAALSGAGRQAGRTTRGHGAAPDDAAKAGGGER